MTHLGKTEAPVSIFNRYPSIPGLSENTVSLIVLDVTPCSLCSVRVSQDSGSVIFLAVWEGTLPSVCFVIHIPSFGMKGGIGVIIV